MLSDLLFRQTSLPFADKVIVFLTYTFAVIIALCVHEFAHAFCAVKCGDPTPKLAGRLTLNPLSHFDVTGLLCFLFLGFGWAKPVPINPFNFRNVKKNTFFVSIAGILSNLILAFLSYPIAILFLRVAGLSVVWRICFCLFLYIFQANLVFMVFNLIPVYPLDGFNAIASLTSYNNKYVNFMHKYGSLILLGLIVVFYFTDLFHVIVSYLGYPIMWFWNLILV